MYKKIVYFLLTFIPKLISFMQQKIINDTLIHFIIYI